MTLLPFLLMALTALEVTSGEYNKDAHIHHGHGHPDLVLLFRLFEDSAIVLGVSPNDGNLPSSLLSLCHPGSFRSVHDLKCMRYTDCTSV